MGRYDDALSYTVRGEELALGCGYAPAAAVMQLTRSWVSFQKNKLSEAVAILRKAEEAVSQSDDFLTRGNIQSAYGRIARRQGRYEQALEGFERAICEYRRARGAELQLARSLLNIGFVNRLIALDIQTTADSEAASRRGAAGAAARAEASRSQRQRIGEIRDRPASNYRNPWPFTRGMTITAAWPACTSIRAFWRWISENWTPPPPKRRAPSGMAKGSRIRS